MSLDDKSLTECDPPIYRAARKKRKADADADDAEGDEQSEAAYEPETNALPSEQELESQLNDALGGVPATLDADEGGRGCGG